MKLPFLMLACAFTAAAVAQDAAPPELTPAEKQFQDSMTNVALEGYFTMGDASELHADRYVIEKVTKVKEDTWKFDARIQFNKRDFKIALSLPVKFAGDTPMISLDNFTVPGFGAFSARILFHDGAYAGTWSGAGPGHNGKMFGKIVKNEPASAQ
jgi:hypothetical protein